MTALQIIGFIGIGIILIGAIFLTKEWVKTGYGMVEKYFIPLIIAFSPK